MQYYVTELMKRLGLMIEYKRNERAESDKKWQVGQFLRVNDANMICDWKTYQKIKTGNLISDDILYDELIEALGYSSNGVIDIIQIMDQLGNDLMIPVDYVDVSKIEETCKNTQKKLLEYPNGFLVDDYMLMIDGIVGNYRDGSYISKKEYTKLKGQFDFSNKEIQAILLDLMYQYVARYIGNLNLINELVESYGFEKRTEHFLHLYYCDYLLYNQRENEAKVNLVDLLGHYKAQENTVRELLLNMKLLNVYDGLFNSEYFFYYKDVLLILNERSNEIPKRMLLATKYGLGMYFYCNNYYEEAFINLEFCYKAEISRYFQCYIFCNYINSKKFIKKIFIDKTFIASEDTKNGIYYNYYMLKSGSESLNNLEKYIIKQIKPNIDKKSFYYEIFLDELSCLTDITHHYKLLRIWNS